jgi:hypothetical protein
MAGLDPAISFRDAPCQPKRDHRDKPGDDKLEFSSPDFAEFTLGRAEGATRGLHPGDARSWRTRTDAFALDARARDHRAAAGHDHGHD